MLPAITLWAGEPAASASMLPPWSSCLTLLDRSRSRHSSTVQSRAELLGDHGFTLLLAIWPRSYVVGRHALPRHHDADGSMEALLPLDARQSGITPKREATRVIVMDEGTATATATTTVKPRDERGGRMAQPDGQFCLWCRTRRMKTCSPATR